MQHETVIVLDFGGQYNQLIARRVRENNVYCEIYSYKTDLSVIKAKNPKGIIFTGGPNSVYLEDSPTIDPEIFSWGVPVLGICYGSQLMMHLLGGHVCRAPEREYGKTEVFVDTQSKLFTDVQPSTICWMSHNDYIEQAAPGFKITAHTVKLPCGCCGKCGKGPVRRAVPPGSAAHGRGQEDAAQLCVQRLRLLRRLEDGLLCGEQRPGPAGAHRRWQGAVRPVRRRGLLGAGCHAGQGHRQAADLRVRGPRPAA